MVRTHNLVCGKLLVVAMKRQQKNMYKKEETSTKMMGSFNMSRYIYGSE
jgi:hypothetical protein